MKAIQRWRNNHAEADARRQRTISSGAIASERARVLGGAGGGYAEPQDILYPSNAASSSRTQESRSAGTNRQTDAKARRKGSDPPPQRQTIISSPLHSPAALDQAPNPIDGLSPPVRSASRIRFDSLIARGAPGPSVDRSATDDKGEKNNTTRWSKPIQKLSPSAKTDVALPEDLVTLPRLRSSRTGPKGDPPIFVVGKNRTSAISDSKPRSSAAAELPLTPPATGTAPSLQASGRGREGGPSSARHLPPQRAASPSSSIAPDRSLSSRSPSAPPQGVRDTLSSSHSGLERDQVSVTASKSSSGLQVPSVDVGQTTPLSSASSSPDVSLMRSSSGKNHVWGGESTLTKSSSTFSLRKARGRLSGVLGSWNRSTPGLNLVEEQTAMQPGSNAGDSHSSQHTSSRSQTLASELNELAVAYEEGLLGEEEYRLLRKGVFDKMMRQGDMEVPKESNLRAPHSSPAGLTSIRTDDKSSLVSASQSKRSGKSIGRSTLFRSRSQRSQEAAPAALPSDRSMASSIGSLAARNVTQGQQYLQEQYSQARRARTLRGASSMNMLDVVAPSNASHSVPNSDMHSGHRMPSSGQSAYTAFSAGGLSITSGNALLARDYADKTSEEIKAEIAVVEAEGKRILTNFKTLQMHAVGQDRYTFDQIRRAIESVKDAVPGASPADIKDDFVMVSSGGERYENGAAAASPTSTRLSSMFVKRRQGSLTDDRSTRSTLKLKTRDINPPSSYRPIPFSAPAAATIPSLESQQSSMGLPDEVAEQELRQDLIEIHKRQVEVSKKYEDRLAFLHSTLRSAKIREGLR